jgi:predicted nucleic acid-binding protein
MVFPFLVWCPSPQPILVRGAALLRGAQVFKVLIGWTTGTAESLIEAGMAWCVTFVTVGELWQWATTRSWGPRTREDLELWLGRVVILNSDDVTARTWGRMLSVLRRGPAPRGTGQDP